MFVFNIGPQPALGTAVDLGANNRFYIQDQRHGRPKRLLVFFSSLFFTFITF